MDEEDVESSFTESLSELLEVSDQLYYDEGKFESCPYPTALQDVCQGERIHYALPPSTYKDGTTPPVWVDRVVDALKERASQPSASEANRARYKENIREYKVLLNATKYTRELFLAWTQARWTINHENAREGAPVPRYAQALDALLDRSLEILTTLFKAGAERVGTIQLTAVGEDKMAHTVSNRAEMSAGVALTAGMVPVVEAIKKDRAREAEIQAAKPSFQHKPQSPRHSGHRAPFRPRDQGIRARGVKPQQNQSSTDKRPPSASKSGPSS
jgi:hypothetical protein